MWHDQLRILVPGKSIGWFVVVDSGWKHDQHCWQQLILVPGKSVVITTINCARPPPELLPPFIVAPWN